VRRRRERELAAALAAGQCRVWPAGRAGSWPGLLAVFTRPGESGRGRGAGGAPEHVAPEHVAARVGDWSARGEVPWRRSCSPPVAAWRQPARECCRNPVQQMAHGVLGGVGRSTSAHPWGRRRDAFGDDERAERLRLPVGGRARGRLRPYARRLHRTAIPGAPLWPRTNRRPWSPPRVVSRRSSHTAPPARGFVDDHCDPRLPAPRRPPPQPTAPGMPPTLRRPIHTRPGTDHRRRGPEGESPALRNQSRMVNVTRSARRSPVIPVRRSTETRSSAPGKRLRRACGTVTWTSRS